MHCEQSEQMPQVHLLDHGKDVSAAHASLHQSVGVVGGGGEGGGGKGDGGGGSGGDGGNAGGDGGVNMQMHFVLEEHEPVLPPSKTWRARE